MTTFRCDFFQELETPQRPPGTCHFGCCETGKSAISSLCFRFFLSSCRVWSRQEKRRRDCMAHAALVFAMIHRFLIKPPIERRREFGKKKPSDLSPSFNLQIPPPLFVTVVTVGSSCQTRSAGAMARNATSANSNTGAVVCVL